MNELVRIQKSKGGKDVVSAKELYLFLSIDDGSNFSKWAKINIEDMFIQNADYQNLRINYENGGRPLSDFALTLDCAKEVAMMSRCENGKQARMYFIECEKKLNHISLPQTFAEALRLAADQADKIAVLQPKAEVYEQIVSADNALTLNDTAKIIGVGRNRMMSFLRDIKILRSNNTPYQQYIDEKYFEVKVRPLSIGDIDKNYTQTFVTGKGLAWLTKRLKSIPDNSLK